jgi:hypothetical protein
MTEAAQAALSDAGLKRSDIDGLLTGYSTTMPHLMLATVFAEHFGVQPSYAHAIQVGGATGLRWRCWRMNWSRRELRKPSSWWLAKIASPGRRVTPR